MTLVYLQRKLSVERERNIVRKGSFVRIWTRMIMTYSETQFWNFPIEKYKEISQIKYRALPPQWPLDSLSYIIFYINAR